MVCDTALTVSQCVTISHHRNKNVFSSRLKFVKVNVSLSQISWKAVPQLQTCSCRTPVSIVAVGPSDRCLLYL